MNMFGWIFSGVFLLFAALAIFTGMRKGRKYTWMYSVARILVVIFSVIASVLIAKLASSLISGALYGVVLNLMDSDLSHTIESMSAAKDLVRLLVTVILAPILFYPVFLIVRGLMTLLVRPLVSLVDLITKAILKACKKEKAEKTDSAVTDDASAAEEDGKKKKKKKAKKLSPKQKRYGVTGPNWVGAICGGVCSFMVLCVFLIPITGLFDMAEDFVELVVEERDAAAQSSEEDGLGDAVLNTVLDIGDGLCNNAGTKIVNYTGGKPVYRWMISSKVSGVRVYLEDELDFAATAVGAYLHMDSADPAKEAEALRKLGPAFAETHLIPGVAAEFISGAATAWSEGDKFMNMEAPFGGEDADEMMRELSSDVWNVLKDTDEDTVKADVNSIVNVLAAAVEHGAVDMVKDLELKSFLKEQTFLETVFYEILANDQLEVLAESTLDYGLELTLNSLDVRFHIAGAYEDMMAELVAVEGNTDDMAKAYQKIMDRYGIATEEDWVAVAALVQNGTSIQNYVAANVVGSQADFENKTAIVTIDDVIASHQGQGSDRVTDSALESKKLAAALYQMGVVLDQTPEEGEEAKWNMITLFPEFGPVLDSLASTEIIGYDETILFMTAFLQSPHVC